jgi:hypothetical protein
MLARAAAQAERARQQAEARQHAAAAREERQAAIKAKTDAKEAARAYIAARTEEVDELNREIEQREAAINGLLMEALRKKPAVLPSAVTEPFVAATFNEAQWSAPPLSLLSRILPGAARRRQERESAAAARYLAALQQFNAAEDARRAAHARKNTEIADFYRKLQALDHGSIVAHFKLAVESSFLGGPGRSFG